jgi:hypothetical protein
VSWSKASWANGFGWTAGQPWICFVRTILPGRTGQVFTLVRLSGGLIFSYLARGIVRRVCTARKRPVEFEVL